MRRECESDLTMNPTCASGKNDRENDEKEKEKNKKVDQKGKNYTRQRSVKFKQVNRGRSSCSRLVCLLCEI